MNPIASTIDHTLLKADCTTQQIIKLCKEANQYSFASVCVPPNMLATAKNHLTNKDVKLCTVIGFPLGYNTTAVKVFETENAIKLGVQEIDMVIAIDFVKSNQLSYISDEINQILQVCRAHSVILKVIIETALLTQEEKVKLYEICSKLGVDYVKTSTGFSTLGATLEDIKLMRELLPKSIKIKASGGIKNRTFAEELLKNGADRLGTSSGLSIINQDE